MLETGAASGQSPFDLWVHFPCQRVRPPLSLQPLRSPSPKLPLSYFPLGLGAPISGSHQSSSEDPKLWGKLGWGECWPPVVLTSFKSHHLIVV